MVKIGIPAVLVASVAGHGYITEPPSRTGASLAGAGLCPYGSCLWFNQGCTIGCPKCEGVEDTSGSCGSDQGTETLPQSMRTYNVGNKKCGINPWCAPGSAPMMNPCGVNAGAGEEGKPGNGGDPAPGYLIGAKGTEMRDGAIGLHRTWTVGDTVDVAWAIVANHGGGYQYRICPKGAEQTEECFQNTPLEFVGDEQYIQYCDTTKFSDPSVLPKDATPDGFNGTIKRDPVTTFDKCDLTNRTKIPAMRINTGTLPSGSTWTRNPIPACGNPLGGSFNFGCHVSDIPGKYKPVPASDYQFPPVGEDEARPGVLLGGFGTGACFGCNQVNNPKDCDVFGKLGRNNCSIDETTAQTFSWNVLDKVKVPDVPAGEYVVSFRWDCEQTPQIWSQCSDVTIVAKDIVV